MRTVLSRIRNNRGETLLESMAAILIFTFASIALLTMFSTAGKMNQTAAQWETAHASQMELAEKAEEAPARGQVTITIGGKSEQVEVAVFGAADGPYAYYLSEEEAGE